VGHRHHRTLHQRRHGALLRDAGCVFADDCGLVDRLSSRFQHLHDTVADKQPKLDLPAALRGAGLAEVYAVSVVDFALAGIDEAEYAVLDAIWPGPMSTQPTADGSRQGVTRRRLPSVHWSVARIESPWKGTEMSVPRNILRVVLLTAAAGLLAVAASVLREKKATVDLTTQQIEDAISALDPGVRAAVIGRLTADAVQQVKDHIDR
jgi:hypothetical protein